MDGDNPILSHWQAEVKVFSKNFSLLQQLVSEDAVHDLRVAIKKLRSYFKLYVALAEKEFDKTLFASTGELFSLLGKQRNIEITRKILLTMAHIKRESLSPVLIYLQLIQDQVAEYCRRSIRHYKQEELVDLTTRLEKGLGSFSAEEILNGTRKLIASSMDNIKDHLNHFDEESHLVRKDLKDIFYRAKIFGNEDLLSKEKLKTIDKILDQLGNIQDHEMMITNLKGFRKTILSKRVDEYSFIKKIEDRAKKRKKSLLRKANDMTVKLVGS
jgi:CHAD domain-containing protein